VAEISLFHVYVMEAIIIAGFVLLEVPSGTNETFLYDYLKEADIEKEYKKIQGKAFSNLLLAIAFCFLFAGFLSGINLRLPFILGIPGIIASYFVVLLFKETPKTKNCSLIIKQFERKLS